MNGERQLLVKGEAQLLNVPNSFPDQLPTPNHQITIPHFIKNHPLRLPTILVGKAHSHHSPLPHSLLSEKTPHHIVKVNIGILWIIGDTDGQILGQTHLNFSLMIVSHLQMGFFL